MSVGDSAFTDCRDLHSVALGNGLETIGDGTFVGCDNLTEIEFPESLRAIGKYAFYHVTLRSAKFRAPKHWFAIDWNKDAKSVRLKNPKKAAALLSANTTENSWERRSE